MDAIVHAFCLASYVIISMLLFNWKPAKWTVPDCNQGMKKKKKKSIQYIKLKLNE